MKHSVSWKKIALLSVCLLLLCLSVSVFADDKAAGEEITLFFTGDIHDYLYPTTSLSGQKEVEHGGAARLATLLKQYRTENSLYADSGDFSMGTLFQAAYSTDAFELRNLGILGCDAVTFGNHEFDFGGYGLAKMLRAAKASGDPLPQLVYSNIDFSGTLTEEQQDLKKALDEYGAAEFIVKECAGLKFGFFGVSGYSSIEDTQTDLTFIDYKEAAKATVQKMKAAGCDVIIGLSHGGMSGSGTSGADYDLAVAVPEIDIIISGHSHTVLKKAAQVGKTVICSSGEYLEYLGRMTFTVGKDGIELGSYELIPVDFSVEEDAETAERLAGYEKKINDTYLAKEGVSFDEIICHSGFDMISVQEMYASHQEYTTGDLIADAYLYEARRNGIDDIDVALVGLGTIRSAVRTGNISVADAFEICSLGVGGDGSAGHPIVGVYITGKELKLLTELDASLGNMVSSIKMSYSGLKYSFNTKRILLDRVTEVYLERPDGSREKIKDNELYKVCANMYAANMLGMLNGLTKGILSITPKDADGNPVTDFYEYSLKNQEGEEIKEWVAMVNYLRSFDKNEEGVPELPEIYKDVQGRKNKFSEGGLAVISHPGTAAKIIPIAFIVVILLLALIVFLICRLISKLKKRRKNARQSA